MISWLFEIDALRLSTKDVTWSATAYSGHVITDSFSGVTMRWNLGGNGLILPNEMTFEVSDPPGTTYTTASFEDKFCTVRLIVDDVEKRTWKFKINRAIEYYGKIKCWAVDFLQEFLVGDYPNTPNPKEVWPSDDTDMDDSYCIPVILGTAYIPVRSVNTGTVRHYVLGESGPTYTVYEVQSPREWPNRSTWTSGSYTMTGSVSGGYQLLQPIIADSTGDGNADAPGLWRSGDLFYDMLCKVSRSDTVTLDNPAEWVEYVLEDFGVASGDIDDTILLSLETALDTLTVGFDGGGWWRKESRGRVLSNLLAQFDGYIKCTDKVEVYQFDATPVETFTKVLLKSFSPSKVTKVNSDSGRVHWPESASKPMDILAGKAIVPTHNGGSETTPSSEILQCRFLSGQSINAQKAGILHFQKKYEQSQRINFAVSFTNITNQDTLSPGDVVTVNNSDLYGGSQNIVLTDMTIRPDMRVDFTGVVLNYLEDWGDLSTASKSVVVDATDGFTLPTTNYTGDIDTVEWPNVLDIPQRFLDNAELGLNVTEEYLGYFDGLDFLTYIRSNGDLRCGTPDTAQGFAWNQSTGAMTVSGTITIQNPSGVRSDLNVANGADVTKTVIDNNLITTGKISNHATTPTLEIDFNNAKITVNKADGLKIASSGELNFYNSSGTKIGTIYYYDSTFSMVAPSVPVTFVSNGSYANIVGSTSAKLIATSTSGYVELRCGSSSTIQCRGNTEPYSNTGYDLGVSGKIWNRVYQKYANIDSWEIGKSTGNDLYFYYGAKKMEITHDDGDLRLDGVVIENSTFSVDTQVHNKWELFNSLYLAFSHHDGAYLSDVLRHKIYDSDALGKTGLYRVGNKPREFIQVLTECMFDINQRLEAIENAKQAV
jgi:hypothetical protein